VGFIHELQGAQRWRASGEKDVRYTAEPAPLPRWLQVSTTAVGGLIALAALVWAASQMIPGSVGALAAYAYPGIVGGMLLRSVLISASASGAFEVLIDGHVVHSKLKTGRYPTVDEILDRL
jgi:selT/selW/selH-like putative selenoprotein